MSIDLGRHGGTAWTAAWRRHALVASRRVAVLLYPRLRERPVDEWRTLLRQARDEPFAGWETGFIVASLVVVTWLLRVEAGILATHSILIVGLVQFVLAVPVLAATVGPVYVRRTRRGLAILLASDRGPSNSPSQMAVADAHSPRKEQ